MALWARRLTHLVLPAGAAPHAPLPPVPACRVLHTWALISLAYLLPLMLQGANEEASRGRVRAGLVVCGVWGNCTLPHRPHSIPLSLTRSRPHLPHHHPPPPHPCSPQYLGALSFWSAPSHWRAEARRWCVLPHAASRLRLHCLALWALLAVPACFQALEMGGLALGVLQQQQ